MLLIDLENDIFTAVAEKVLEAHPAVTVTGEYADTLSKLPTVTIEERDNAVLQSMRTLNIENAVSVMYEVNVFSNKTPAAKSDAKRVMSTVDNAFAEAGFTRTYKNQIPNFQDKRIHRIVARYEAVIGPAQEEGKYLIYQA